MLESLAVSFWGFHFDSTAIVAIAIAVFAIFLIYQFKTMWKENPRKVAVSTVIVIVVLALGAFVWKYCGPALDKYLNNMVDQSINGKVQEPEALPEGQDADSVAEPEELQAKPKEMKAKKSSSPSKKQVTGENEQLGHLEMHASDMKPGVPEAELEVAVVKSVPRPKTVSVRPKVVDAAPAVVAEDKVVNAVDSKAAAEARRAELKKQISFD
ncbi:MAG: hypothetical protein IJ268_05310 [Proteobacteria bacterium]|nr:hypothetical protein [Pseudomonadota bacterium]